MVRQPTFCALASLWLGLVFAADTAARADSSAFGFQTECMKKEIFQGEAVTCSFVVVSSDDMIDVEVAKFPEFRGFWSDNLALRQGPIPLVGGLWGDRVRKGVVGTYTLIPMIGRSEPSIIPMKIVVRRPMSPIQVDLTVQSEPSTLTVKPLPPLPAGFDPRYFHGAVGLFSIYPETREILFQKDEPVTLRVSLQGEGNFPELNELEITFPEKVEVLGRRSFSQGIGQYSSKMFEITVAVHAAENFTLPPTPFVYFNPTLGRYEQLQIPQLEWRNVPATAKSPDAENDTIVLAEPDETWTSYRPLQRSPLFWLFHVLGAAAVGWAIAADAIRRRKQQRKLAPTFQRKIRLDIARQAADAGNIETFLRIGDEIACEILREHTGASPGLTRYQALRLAEGNLDAGLLLRIRLLLSTFETFAYSPVKTSPANLQPLTEALTYVVSQNKPGKKAA